MVPRTFVLALTLIGSLGVSSAVLAASAKETMNSFGVFGIWAVDCGRDQTKETFVARTAYTVSVDGPVETFSLSMANGDILSWRKTIKSARIVGGNLELMTQDVSAESTNPAFNERPDRALVKQVLAKQDNKLVTLDAYSVDGKSIYVRGGELVLQSSQGPGIAGKFGPKGQVTDRKILPLNKCSK